MRAPQNTKSAAADQPAAPEPIKRIRRHPELEAALGARIRAARIAAKISQSALGEAVGISFQQVQKYELGKDRVAASTLQGIAATLGVHPGSFFDESVPAPVGRSIPDVKAMVNLGQRIQRVRDPVIAKRLLALIDILGEIEDETSGASSDGTP